MDEPLLLSPERLAHRDVAQQSYAARRPGRSVDEDSTLAFMMAAAGYALDWRDAVFVKIARDLRGSTALDDFPPFADWAKAGLVALGLYVDAAKDHPERAFIPEMMSTYTLAHTLGFATAAPFALIQAQVRAGHAFEQLKRSRGAQSIDPATIAAILEPYRELRRSMSSNDDLPSDATLLGESVMTHAMMWRRPRRKGPRHRPGASATSALVQGLRGAFLAEGLGEPTIDDYVDAWMHITASGPRLKIYKTLHGVLSKRNVIEAARDGRGARRPRPGDSSTT